MPLISLKGTHYSKDVILYTLFFYVRYAVSYRGLKEIMQERGITADHATSQSLGYPLPSADCSTSEKTKA